MLRFKKGLQQMKRLSLQRILFALFYVVMVGMSVSAYAQEKKKLVQARSVSSSVPYGYTQVGNTMLYFYQSSSSIDIQGCYNGMYYGSTYGNGGYKVAMQVNDGSATQVDCLNGSTIDGVSFSAVVEPQGELARICYVVTNTTEQDVSVSLGTHADVMIGSNDRAPISRRIDTVGSTYGVTMKDGNGAQLCVLFGSGLAGVTSVSDYWFGYYGTNNSAYNMVGNYSSGSNYMEENGSYDSGMGWCWKNRTVPAGETMVFSYLIGVGEVNLEPNSSFEVTPDDPEGWNNLLLPHRLTLEGTYESPAGLDGMIEYAVEDSEEWLPLTEMMPSGSTFSESLVATFDVNREKHVIRFRTVDNVGNATMLHPIEYLDVACREYHGVTDQTYTGDSLFQTVECDGMESSHITTSGYSNNVNAGIATFYIEGVFPYTIGRKASFFRINPAPLMGDIELSDMDFVYNGADIMPEWWFTEESNGSLVQDVDYTVSFANNRYPGKATVSVTGIGNYTSALTKEFYIDKAELSDDLYIAILPQEDICYDGNEHKLLFAAVEGVGAAHIEYVRRGETETVVESPVEEGCYDVYMEVADGDWYYGRQREYMGSFTIYHFDETEWASLNALYEELIQMGYSCNWNMADGIKAVSSFEGLSVKQGSLVGIDLSGKSLSGTLPATIAAFTRLESIDLSSNNLSGDISGILAALKMQNPQAFEHLKMLNISHNQYKGNVGVLASCLPELTSLDVSHNKFEDVYPMISPNVTDLNISCQDMERVVEVNLSNTASIEDMVAKIPSILFYDHENQAFKTDAILYITTADMSSYNPDDEDSDEWVMMIFLEENSGFALSMNTFYGECGDTLKVWGDLNVTEDNIVEGTSFKATIYFERGDANFINGVDVADLQATILYAFGLYEDNRPFNYTAADTYRDFNINVQDVVCTVNILLENMADTLNSSMSKGRSGRTAESVGDVSAYIYKKGNSIVLRSDVPVASLSVKAAGDINWNTEQYGMSQAVSKGNLVSYSLTGTTLPSNEEVVIGECGDNARIYSVSMSDVEAHAVNAAVLDSPATSVEAVDAESGELKVYGISGMQRKELMKGVNLIRYKDRTIKVLNK